MKRLRMAVVGVGHLGKEHARILAAMPDVELVAVVDVNGDQARAVATRCQAMAYGDYWPLFNRVDAAVVAVPTSHHHEVASAFLKRGISLLVEKPLASDLSQAEDLVALAHQHDAILQVGHVERFNPAFEELQRRPLRPKFITCERLGGFTGRSMDIGVVLDLMIHDLDLILALVRSPVVDVQALGMSLFGAQEDLANARLTFANGCVADVTASRASMSPARRMRLMGAEGFASVDFARRQVSFVQPHPGWRQTGLDLKNPAAVAMLKEGLFGRFLQTTNLDLGASDQLTAELRHFVHCVRTHARPLVDGRAGCEAMALAGRVLASLRTHLWEGTAGPMGPHDLPAPAGALFTLAEDQAA